jgi:histone deacetylase complex regulatory component SIN3
MSDEIKHKITDSSIFIDILDIFKAYLSNSDSSGKKEIEDLFKFSLEILQRESFVFYCVSSFVCLLKYIVMAYERLDEVKSVVRGKIIPNPVAIKMNLVEDAGSEEVYKDIVSLVKEYLNEEIDCSVFEEKLRYLSECKAYKISGIDKLFSKIERQCALIVDDETSANILRMINKNVFTRSSIESISGDEILYKFIKEAGELRILQCNGVSGMGEKWQEYIDKFIKMKCDDSLVRDPMFLKRCLRESIGKSVISYRMECKICSSSLKLKFVENTEDFLMRINVKRRGGL